MNKENEARGRNGVPPSPRSPSRGSERSHGTRWRMGGTGGCHAKWMSQAQRVEGWAGFLLCRSRRGRRGKGGGSRESRRELCGAEGGAGGETGGAGQGGAAEGNAPSHACTHATTHREATRMFVYRSLI